MPARRNFGTAVKEIPVGVPEQLLKPHAITLPELPEVLTAVPELLQLLKPHAITLPELPEVLLVACSS